MSRPSNLPNDKDSVRAYVQRVGSLPFVEKILLGGSRSPLRNREHRPESDRDLIVVSNIPNLKIPHPRRAGQIHADLIIVTKDKEHNVPKTVEIYPEDRHNLLS